MKVHFIVFSSFNKRLAIWRATPSEGWPASLVGNLVSLPVTRFVCDRFSDLLFAWNKRKGIGKRGPTIDYFYGIAFEATGEMRRPKSTTEQSGGAKGRRFCL